MFTKLQNINKRPKPFSINSVAELWTNEHTAQQMLQYHLNEEVAMASRTREVIDSSVAWLQSRFKLGSDTSVADFGCGPGLYTSRFAKLGAKVCRQACKNDPLTGVIGVQY